MKGDAAITKDWFPVWGLPAAAAGSRQHSGTGAGLLHVGAGLWRVGAGLLWPNREGTTEFIPALPQLLQRFPLTEIFVSF